MTIIIRRAFGALIILAFLLAGAGPASAGHSGGAGRSASEPRTGLHPSGIELRRNGVGPCSPSTPAPCSNYVYNFACPSATTVRVTRVRTYMAAVDPQVVGFRLRARLIPRSRPATGIPWATDVETFPSRPTAISRLMEARNVSDAVSLTRRWNLQVEVRFDRRSQPDVVRSWEGQVNFTCS